MLQLVIKTSNAWSPHARAPKLSRTRARSVVVMGRALSDMMERSQDLLGLEASFKPIVACIMYESFGKFDLITPDVLLSVRSLDSSLDVAPLQFKLEEFLIGWFVGERVPPVLALELCRIRSTGAVIRELNIGASPIITRWG